MFSFLKKEPTLFLLSKVWKFVGTRKLSFIVVAIVMTLVQLISLATPIVFGFLINEIQLYGLANIGYVSLLVSSFVVIEIVARGLGGPGAFFEMVNAFYIDRTYKKFLYNGVLSLPLAWHNDHESGNTIDKINKSTLALYDTARNVSTFLYVWVRVLGTTLVLMYFDAALGLITLGMLVLSLVIMFYFDKKLVSKYKILNEFDNKASAKVFDSLSNITTVKVLGIERPVSDSMIKSSWASFSQFNINNILNELKWGVSGVMFALVVAIPIMFHVWTSYLTTGIILIGTLSTLYLYLSNLIGVYYTFAGMYSNIILDKTRLQNVAEIEAAFESKNRIVRTKVESWNTLNIINLNFAYDEVRSAGFTNFNITIKRGEKIAFIGESGSGKSTLLKILHGMYETASAKVSIDGAAPVTTNFADLDLESTLVPQEPEVFSASIRENITLLLDFDDEAIRNASDMAMFTDVIEQLPKKIESVVNEKGVNLSGGQKQRLALTRALLFSKDKKIMLLDESTSSVDSVNEVKIYKNIFENFRDATIIASIHKMNLLKYFDRIVILEKGTIRAEGSFDELLARDAEFKKSWEEFVLSHKEGE